MKLTGTLFEISRDDLETSKLLFDNRFYPHAVFYLQQSVEKANKSFAILNGIIKEDELKKIGHDSMKIYEKIINKQKERLEKINKGIKIVPKIKETKLIKNLNIEKYFKTITTVDDSFKSLSKEREKILFIDKSEINLVIKELDKIETELQELDLKHIMEFSENDFNKIKKEYYIEFLDTFYNLNPQKIEKVKEELEKTLTFDLMEKVIRVFLSIKEGIYVSYSLFYLSLIMLPHAVVTRYPDNNLNPLEIYNKNLPLVQLFGELVEIMEKTLFKMENLIRVLEKKGDKNASHYD